MNPVQPKQTDFSEFIRNDEFAASQWLEALQVAPELGADQQLVTTLTSAAEHALQHETSRAALLRGLATGAVVCRLGVDKNTILASVLFPLVADAELAAHNQGEIEKLLHSDALGLIDNVKKMDAMRSLQLEHEEHDLDADQIENLRKMLLAMVDDPRAIIIKLAERVCLLRDAKNLAAPERVGIASETRDIYAPLANRLGIGQLKWELEDLAFRYLQPDTYKSIAKNLAERRPQREVYLREVIDTLSDELTQLGVDAQIDGRAKHIYSIWRKMDRKKVGFEEIYDVRAVRILVDQVQECYAALGIAHSLWQHIPKEFDDYIATPKGNGYRSLHTAVVGPQGKGLEIQIRTRQMHDEAELGVAAHWAYKEGASSAGKAADGRLAWLRQLLEWQQEVVDLSDPEHFYEDFRNEIKDERIYVFTPAGKVVDLNGGATPLDFAYSVHTSLGHRCKGAKVNGRIVPLNYALKTGEKVEVLAGKDEAPSRDWISPHHGYVKSSRARSKISQWFRRLDREDNAKAGKAMLEKEWQRLDLKKVDMDALAAEFNLKRASDLYAAVGAGDKGINTVVNRILAQQEAERAADADKPGNEPLSDEKISSRKSKVRKTASSDITVLGVGDLLTSTARCCKPLPGEPITGYVTKSRGVVVHRSDCNHIIRAQNERPERLIEVQWGAQVSSYYQVEIHMQAYNRHGLLKDITTLLANEKVSLAALNTEKQKVQEYVDIFVELEMNDMSDLGRVISLLGQLPNVLSVQRYQR